MTYYQFTCIVLGSLTVAAIFAIIYVWSDRERR